MSPGSFIRLALLETDPEEGVGPGRERKKADSMGKAKSTPRVAIRHQWSQHVPTGVGRKEN